MKYRKIFIFNRTKKKADQIKEDFIKKLKKSLKSEIYSDNLKNINSELEKTDLLRYFHFFIKLLFYQIFEIRYIN